MFHIGNSNVSSSVKFSACEVFFFFPQMNNVLDLGSTSDLDYILNRLLSKNSHQVEDLR